MADRIKTLDELKEAVGIIGRKLVNLPRVSGVEVRVIRADGITICYDSMEDADDEIQDKIQEHVDEVRK